MASEIEMYEIIRRTVADKMFLEALIADPEAAAGMAGYGLTPGKSHHRKSLAQGR